MEIIMLTGKSNTGKTAALHFVHEILIATGEVKKTRVKRVGSDKQRDFSAVLEYSDKKIMIFTMGDVDDDDETIAEDLEEAIKIALCVRKCDFFICACNNDEFYNKLKKKEYPLFENVEYYLIKKTEKKTQPDKWLATNWDDANKIIKRLKERIPEATSLTVTQIVSVKE